MSFPEEGFAMMPTVDKEYSHVWLTKCFDYSKSGFSIAINMSSCAKVSTVMAPSGRPSKQARIEKVADVSGILKGVFGPIGWKPRYKASEELVYTILSQHTSDINSERAFYSLMDRFKNLDRVADASVESIEETIRHGGLARSKAPRIKNILNQVRAEVGSFDLSFLTEMPLQDAKVWLTKLNGVGPKTAAIILCFSFGLPVMPVDTHIHRVAKRLRLIGPKITAEAAHDLLEEIVDPNEVFPFHMYLIQHGRKTCKARFPRCDECQISHLCPSRGKV